MSVGAKPVSPFVLLEAASKIRKYGGEPRSIVVRTDVWPRLKAKLDELCSTPTVTPSGPFGTVDGLPIYVRNDLPWPWVVLPYLPDWTEPEGPPARPT